MSSRTSEDEAFLPKREQTSHSVDEAYNTPNTRKRGRIQSLSLPILCGALSVVVFVASIIAASVWLRTTHNGDGGNEVRLAKADTVNGTYKGIDLPQFKQHVFLGIPYAAAPLDHLRFRRPQPHNETWTGERDAIKYGRNCPGYGDRQEKFSHGEDCLTINVVRPYAYASSGHAPLPVGVYIYGGGTHGGSSEDGRYNMSFIVSAASDVDLPFVAVSFNYRSSLWGFLDGQEARGSGVTNLGLHDQRMALAWVRDNIAAFGGDPYRVTIWGGSSGADNVGHHLLAADEGLFRAAILQSGGPMALTTRPATAQMTYNNISEAVGCSTAEDTLDCLRSVPYETLSGAFMDGSEGTSTAMTSVAYPAIDGTFITHYGSLKLKEGRFIKVPILAGVVANEGSNFIPSHVRDWSDFRTFLIQERGLPSQAVDHLMPLYPDPPVGTNDDGDDKLDPPIRAITSAAEFARMEQLLGDIEINAADRLLCETYTAAGAASSSSSSLTSARCHSFLYAAAITSAVDPRRGVTHGSEIGPLFQNTAGVGFEINPFSGKAPAFFDMSRAMGLAWAGFITHLNPDAGLQKMGLAWPRYSLGDRRRMVFNETGAWVDSDESRREA